MKEKLRVPAPPAQQSLPARGRFAKPPLPRSGRRRGARRTRFEGCAAGLLAALLVFVGVVLLWQCALLAGVPALLAAGDGGRTNVLLLGIDRRGGTEWTYRTDTIVVFTADPGQGTAGLLSIPRDLQVPIPTVGEDRINTANVYGDLRDYPGGGPALLAATVEANFGIPIDGYVLLDFRAFERIVDAVGGIDVDVPRALDDDRYPDPRPGDPYAYTTLHFDPGPQHMDGARALAYARSRMSTSDFDRAQRQQQILLALRHKALSLGGIAHWPALAAALVDSARTDLGPGGMAGLALLAVRVDPAQMQQVVLQPPLVTGYRRADGAAVQRPNWDRIEPVIRDLFGGQ
jgi:LCP family protein required for cell wall assembly